MFLEGIAQIVIKDDELAKSSFCGKIVSDFGFSSDLVSECYQLFVSIYDEAFVACKNLNRVKFGLGGRIKTCNAFYGCSSLQEIVFAGTEERWGNRNGFGILFASCKILPKFIFLNETLSQGEAAREIPIEDLDFSVRTYNCLKRANIHYVKDLCDLQREDICKIRNIGQKGVDEVMKKMEELGLL